MANLSKQMERIAKSVAESSVLVARISSATKDKILRDVARQLKKSWKTIKTANAKDLAYAERLKLSATMKDRLLLDRKSIVKMAQAIAEVAELRDPVGHVISKWRRPNGIEISKVSVPLGTIFIIYESRPNVTSECASLCLKSGNAVILRGGREAFHSNQAIADVYQRVILRHHLPREMVTLIQTTAHSAVDELLQFDQYINLVIPRGGEALIRKVAALSRIPVIKHYKGICHVYVDREADLKMALDIAFNAKCQRYSVCNAMETLLVNQGIAGKFLPRFADLLRMEQCEIRGDQKTRALIRDAKPATEEDWHTEYLDRILSIRTVKNVDEAINHINHYGSGHTDAIVTKNKKTAEKFLAYIDSSSVMINASTRFSDGNEYGFGAEIGISTDKIHARGPMGLEGLTSYKYIVRGKGHIRK